MCIFIKLPWVFKYPERNFESRIFLVCLTSVGPSCLVYFYENRRNKKQEEFNEYWIERIAVTSPILPSFILEDIRTPGRGDASVGNLPPEPRNFYHTNACHSKDQSSVVQNPLREPLGFVTALNGKNT